MFFSVLAMLLCVSGRPFSVWTKLYTCLVANALDLKFAAEKEGGSCSACMYAMCMCMCMYSSTHKMQCSDVVQCAM